MAEPSAKVIADSISVYGHRLTTMEVVIHRFVLAELNTHRVLSKNSASSRAIPVHKQLQRVRQNPAMPVVWPREQKGMQGGDELDDASIAAAQDDWLYARNRALDQAEALAMKGVHKSVTNRLLEPFMWHTVVITGTAWQNFFSLRCNPMAQPEIRVAAEAMQAAYLDSVPTELKVGEWHLPYLSLGEMTVLSPADAVRISSARCARTSYMTQDGVRDIDEDIRLYKRLTSADPMHATPLEHVATPALWNVHTVEIPELTETDWSIGGARVPKSFIEVELPKYGNLLGWHQHRFDVETEKKYQSFS